MSPIAHSPVANPTSFHPPTTSTANPHDSSRSAVAARHSVIPIKTQVGKPPSTVLPLPPTTHSAQVTKSKSKKKKTQVTVTMATAATAQSGAQGAQGENTGRWTAEEHRLFLQGLEQHGKGWKKIASLIKSRTVVQIRTHAQKYFQKLAKARQNGEEGDVSMEGRGGAAAMPSLSAAAAQSSKRRRQTSGTKRKAIQSVVASAQRQAKKLHMEHELQTEVPNPTTGVTFPTVAPALSPYVLPSTATADAIHGRQESAVPSITTAQGTISGPALEDSLFRFLTPVPISPSEPQVNEIARQAGANPITLPIDQPGASHNIAGGEVSPTGVADFSMYPSWTDAKDTPSWYAKGSDVDALLDVADTLDWLTDTGDLQETYHPSNSSVSTNNNDNAATNLVDTTNKMNQGLSHTPAAHNMSLNTLAHVDASVDVVVPPLPSLFDGAAETDVPPEGKAEMDIGMSSSPSSQIIDEHLQVFDTPLEEHDFVSTILENNGESINSLPVLG